MPTLAVGMLETRENYDMPTASVGMAPKARGRSTTATPTTQNNCHPNVWDYARGKSRSTTAVNSSGVAAWVTLRRNWRAPLRPWP